MEKKIVMKMSILVLCGILIVTSPISAQDNYFMEGKCNMRHRHDSCPDGYCCAYDEFFRSIIYCKEYGTLGKSCSTVDSDQDCRCGDGLMCQPFTQGGSFVSIYGRCVTDPNASTTPTVTTDVNTTTDMSSVDMTSTDALSNVSMITRPMVTTTDMPKNHGHQDQHTNNGHTDHTHKPSHGHPTGDKSAPLVG